MSASKTGSHRVYVNDDDAKAMQAICSTNELTPKELLDLIAKAGIRAIEADGGRITLPLRFAVVMPGVTASRYLNEPAPSRKK